MKEIKFEIPGLLPTFNTYTRWHWRKQRAHTANTSMLVREALGLKLINTHKAFKKCIIVVERHSTKDPKDMDWDGIFFSVFKEILDSQTGRHELGVGIIEDDSIACIVSCPVIIPVKCKKGEEKAVVKIMKVD